MRKDFMNLPDVLKREIVIRFVFGILFLFLFLILVLSKQEYFLYLTSLLFGIYFLIDSIKFLLVSILAHYVCVQGVCSEIETGIFRKKIKSIVIDLEVGKLKVLVQRKIKDVAIGDTVVVYLSDKSPVYEQDGRYIVSNYYSLKINKRSVKE